MTIMLAGGGTLIYTLIDMGTANLAYAFAWEEYQFLPETENEQPTVNEVNLPEEAITEENNWWEASSVNITSLTLEYPDVVGWLFFEDGSINYPVVYSGDNEKYLRTAYNGSKTTAGSIFVDGDNSPDFADPHTLVYGHNMKNGTMFGALKKYRDDKQYYLDHRYFQIVTNKETYRYEIFAQMEVDDHDYLYSCTGRFQPDWWDTLRTIQYNSDILVDIPVSASDHIITLSTCTSDDEKRFILCAVRIDEHYTG